MAVTAAYETVVVISLKFGEEKVEELVNKFKTLIENNATLESVDEWGKRKLAYEINKETEGFYVLYSFVSSAEFPAEFDRVLQITDGVLRSMIVKKGA